jgi:hypothetical protein
LKKEEEGEGEEEDKEEEGDDDEDGCKQLCNEIMFDLEDDPR